MRKNLILASALALSTIATAQIPNAGFENWTASETYGHPVVSPSEFTSTNSLAFEGTGVEALTQIADADGGFAARAETVMFDGELLPGFGIFGNVDQEEDLLFTGGFPYNQMSAVGLSVDLRYEIDESAPGYIIVQFLTNAAPTMGIGGLPGTYLFPISGTQTAWTTETFDFQYPLSEAPDHCVITFVSNDITTNTFVLGNYIEVDNFALVGATAQVPGGDMNTWVESESTQVLDEWFTQIVPGFTTASQSDVSAEGNFSALLETIVIEDEIIPGFISTTDVGSELSTTLSLPAGATSLTFQYQYATDAIDGGLVYLLLGEDEDTNEDDGLAFFETLPPAAEWTTITVDFSSALGLANNFALAFINTSNLDGSADASSQLWIDDVSFNTLQPCADVPVITISGDSFCEGDDLSASTGEYLTYTWFAADSGTDEFEIVGDEQTIIGEDAEPGSTDLYVTVTGADCFATSEITTVVINETPDPTITQTGTTLSTAMYDTYQWYLAGELIEDATNQTYEALEDGSYSVVATNGDCEGASEDFLYTGIENLENTFSIFPNPAQDQLQINGTSAIERIVVFDSMGKIALNQSSTQNAQATLDLSQLPNGLYTVQIQSNETMSNHRIIVKK